MEVVIPTQTTMDFDFSSAVTSPYSSVPSTPKRFGDYFFSAPASPTRMSEFYKEFEEFSISINDGYGGTSGSSSSFVPKKITSREDQEEFAFDFSVELERASLSADELFDGGKIKPLEPPPRSETRGLAATKSFKSPLTQGKKIIRNALSPKRTAVDETQKRSANERGRDRAPALSSSSRRATRSLSPLRVSEYPWEEEQEVQENNNNKQQLGDLATKDSLISSPSSNKSSSRKWSLKDFLLFRSASEGRATDKDPFMRRYTITPFNKKQDHQDIKRADSSGSSGSRSRRRGPVSAHELHYNRKRAAAEDSKRKTYLPYKQSILGRLSFSPAVNAIANGFGSLTRA